MEFSSDISPTFVSFEPLIISFSFLVETLNQQQVFLWILLNNSFKSKINVYKIQKGNNGKLDCIICVFFQWKKLFCSVNFFPPKFFLFRKISLFQNTRKNFGGEKISWTKKFFRWAKKVGPFLIFRERKNMTEP